MYITQPSKTILMEEKMQAPGTVLLQHSSVGNFVSPYDAENTLYTAEMEAFQALFLVYVVQVSLP